MFDFTSEAVLNDLSRVSVIDDTQTLSAPGAPTLTDGGATAGATLANVAYYYKITALSAKGETTAGTQATVTPAAANSSVGLTWTAVTGAVGYHVYRGTTSNGENVQYYTATNSFTDTGAAGVSETPPSTNTAYVVSDPQVQGGAKALYIKRLNKFINTNAGKVYRRLATAPVQEVATITLPVGTAVAGIYRLNVQVIMSGSYPIDYDRWAVNKGKPFYVEVNVPSGQTADVLAQTLQTGIANGLKKYNGQNINDIVVTQVSNSGSHTGSLIITCANEYQRIVFSEIELSDSTGETWSQIAAGTVTTHGVEGFGTAWFITKNLRLPTQEATRFYGEDQDERPVNGVMYNQYTFQYNALRNFTGTAAVGSTITSKTTHVLYVPQTLAATFEGYITSAFGANSLVDAASNQFLN